MKKLTVGEVQSRLNKVYLGVVTLKTYVGMHGPSTFADRDYGEWQADTSNVLKGIGHPLRSQRLRVGINCPPIDQLLGRTFGEVTILKVDRDTSGQHIAHFQCTCGRISDTPLANLIKGRARSCGCLQKQGQRLVASGDKKCPTCQAVKPTSEFHRSSRYKSGAADYCIPCTDLARKKRDQKVKQQVMDGYGGKCSCCGEDRLPFLTVEHTWHNGKADREAIPSSMWYRYLLRSHLPQNLGLTIFCMNCQLATKNSSICPHQLTQPRSS